MSNVMRIRHLGIVTDDLERSLVFYRDLLGFRVDAVEDSSFIDKILHLQESRLRTVKLSAPDGQLIELLDFGNPSPAKCSRGLCDAGLTHFAIQVSSVAMMVRRLAGQGIEFLSGPEISPDGNVRVVFCRTPEGAFLELVELLQRGGEK